MAQTHVHMANSLVCCNVGSAESARYFVCCGSSLAALELYSLNGSRKAYFWDRARTKDNNGCSKSTVETFEGMVMALHQALSGELTCVRLTHVSFPVPITLRDA